MPLVYHTCTRDQISAVIKYSKQKDLQITFQGEQKLWP